MSVQFVVSVFIRTFHPPCGNVPSRTGRKALSLPHEGIAVRSDNSDPHLVTPACVLSTVPPVWVLTQCFPHRREPRLSLTLIERHGEPQGIVPDDGLFRCSVVGPAHLKVCVRPLGSSRGQLRDLLFVVHSSFAMNDVLPVRRRDLAFPF